jgi:hypothetical protein
MSTMSNYSFNAAVETAPLEAAINAMTLAIGPIVLALHAIITFLALHAIVKHVVTNHIVPSFKAFDRTVTAFVVSIYNACIRPYIWTMCCILFMLLHVVLAMINVRLIAVWHVGTWADCYRRSGVKGLKGILASYVAYATFG